MKRYLVDTTILAAGLFRRPAAVELLGPWIAHREAATSILVYGEVVEYLRGLSDFPGHHGQLRELLAEVKPYFVTYAIMERYASIRRALRPPHGPGLIGDVDILIAATAIERKLTLVTADSDFERVPDLQSDGRAQEVAGAALGRGSRRLLGNRLLAQIAGPEVGPHPEDPQHRDGAQARPGDHRARRSQQGQSRGGAGQRLPERRHAIHQHVLEARYPPAQDVRRH